MKLVLVRTQKKNQCRYKEEELNAILQYLKSFPAFASAGMVEDVFTGERFKKENIAYNDGEYQWSSQDIYHIEKYNFAVEKQFYEKIRKSTMQ